MVEEMFELDMDTEPVAKYGKDLKTGVKDGLGNIIYIFINVLI